MSRLALAAIAFAATISPSAVNAAATEPRLEAFRTVCVPDRQNYDALKKAALVEGWEPVQAGAHPELDSLMEVSRTIELEPDIRASLASYAKAVAGGEAFLVLTDYASEQIDLVGCYVYDFEADAPIDPELVSDWLGAPPTESVNQPSVIVGHTWGTPPGLPGTWDVYLAFLPEGSAATAFTGFSGVVIKISSVHPKET